jgi:hypothetical protein
VHVVGLDPGINRGTVPILARGTRSDDNVERTPPMRTSHTNATRAGLLLGLLAAASPSVAETSSDSMRAFGLIGSWSEDCSTDMTRPCADVERCFPRLTFILPLEGNPSEEVMSPSAVSGLVYKSAIAIDSAAQLPGGKIKIATTAAVDPSDPVTTPQTKGETWETVYQKTGTSLRVWSAQNANGSKIAVRDGYRYEPASDGKQWRQTNQQTPALDKCLN